MAVPSFRRVQDAVSLENGTVSVWFKPLQGKENQAGGLVWRWKDANTYYVARGNALENNVSLYYVCYGECVEPSNIRLPRLLRTYGTQGRQRTSHFDDFSMLPK